MIRRKTAVRALGAKTSSQELLGEVLRIFNPALAEICRKGNLERLPSGELDRLLPYLENVLRNLQLFIPAREAHYGISERGGDAILGYLRNRNDSGSYFFFADVSGFTALLTFLTERFGKEEAGDIMNLGILNRFCLNKMGLLLHHFRDEYDSGDRGLAALKVMLAIRASMPQITAEVRGELGRKLAGKPHQDEIEKFINALVVKASGGLIFDPEPGSAFYGSRVRSRITWGNTGKRVAQAEKLGGNDDPVSTEVEEVKGFALDEHCHQWLEALYESKWLGIGPQDLAVSAPHDSFRKVVIRSSGMDKIEPFVKQMCSEAIQGSERDGPATVQLSPEAKRTRIAEIGAELPEVERYLGNRVLLLHIVRNLDHGGDRNFLLDESASVVRDSGIIFCNFEIPGPEVLDALADTVHQEMARYGIHYKYNIFPKGDFNLMGVLGTMFSEKRGTDRYFAEILWNTWRDLKSSLEKSFGSAVKIRGGMSVGKGLQGPAGDNIVNNEETIIGPDCNLAARLVNEALETDREHRFVFPSGTMFTIEAQRKKIEHLIQPAPPVREASLKGFSKPVALYALRERDEIETVAEFIARLRKVPLVTVEGEIVRSSAEIRRGKFLSRCLEVIEAAAGGKSERPQLIAFIAQSGVGKTRRIAELANWALERRWPVYFGECYSWYQGEGPGGADLSAAPGDEPEHHSDEGAYPFFPFIRILKEQIFRIGNLDSPAVKREKIANTLAGLDPARPELKEQAPVMASFIGVTVAESGLSAALDAEARRNIFYERTADIFARQAAECGANGVVLLCIDDLQWSDRNTLHLLSFILRRSPGRLVVCVNARKPGQLGILLDKDLPVDRHVLKPGLLKASAIDKLAGLVLGLDPDRPDQGLPEVLKNKLQKELERNPFFVIEFCNKILEQEILSVADGRCTRFDDESFQHVSIPTRIQGVIEDRISRLPQEEHAAIQYSSVLGNILRYIIIRRFLPKVDRHNLFRGTDLEEIFSRLTGQEITRLENEKDPDWVYSFRRALIGEKLYQELIPSMRKSLHKEVAGVFENTQLANQFEKALLTALHYSNAEVPDKSCAFYLEAGRLAREVFDNERSLMLFDRIDKILSEYRVKGAFERRMVMLEDRGQVHLLLGHYDKALEDFGGLAKMAAARGDTEKEASAQYLIGRTYFTRSIEGDYPQALEHFARVVSKTSEPRLLAEAKNDMARTYLETGERDRALKLLDEAEEVFLRAAGRELTREERGFKASLLRNRGSVFHRKGEFRKAIEIYEAALELVADESENHYKKMRAMLLNSIGLSLMKAFKLEESLDYFRRALALTRSIGDLKTEVQVRINMGVVANDLGRNQEALQTLTEQHDTLEVLVGETRELAALQFNIGESHMFMENFAAAEPWYRRALNIGERIGYKEFVVGARYNLAEVLYHLKRSEEALEVLEPAFAMAREGGWELQEMDIANLLGEIHREQGRYSRAHEYHGRAVALSRSLEDDFGASWAIRNVAVDTLSDPKASEADKRSCISMLEQSLELARKAGQPENLMYSLRELILWKIAYRPEELASAKPLYLELKKLAKKVSSKTFDSFCRSVRKHFE